MEKDKQNHNNLELEQKKKKSPIIISIMVCMVVLVIIIILLAIIGVVKWKQQGKHNYQIEIETTEPVPVVKAERFNFVVFGIDDIGYTPQDIYRSDMIMVVSLDPEAKYINLISILRDTRVPIEGLEPQKINKAYQEGGADFALKTINDAFHTNFDKYLTLDFQDLVFLVDDIGGIDVEITWEEADKINQYVQTDISLEGRNTYCEDVEGGLAHLDGTQATMFSRTRAIDSDYDRAWRQQRTLKAVQQKVQTMSVEQMPYLAQELMSNVVETNLSLDDVLEWLSKDVVHYEIVSAVVPDWAYEHDIYGGIDDSTEQWVWIYDLEEGAARIHSILEE